MAQLNGSTYKAHTAGLSFLVCVAQAYKEAIKSLLLNWHALFDWKLKG